MNQQNQMPNVYDEVINCIRRIGLPIIKEVTEGNIRGFESEVKSEDIYSIRILVTYDPNESIVAVEALISHSIPDGRVTAVSKLIKLINKRLNKDIFGVFPCTGIVILFDNSLVQDEIINIDKFLMFFKKHIGYGITYFPLIVNQVYSSLKPKVEFAKFLKREKKSLADSGIRMKVINKGKSIQRSKNKKFEILPFDVYVSSIEDRVQFPTHSRGLYEIGLPEFFIDPLCLGAVLNAQRIAAAYEYFVKSENKGKLEAILNGDIIELKSKELHPETKKETYVYCFREVAPDFEAVKMAYEIDETGTEPGRRYVQIWIKGDDYALNNEYYKGGIIF